MPCQSFLANSIDFQGIRQVLLLMMRHFETNHDRVSKFLLFLLLDDYEIEQYAFPQVQQIEEVLPRSQQELTLFIATWQIVLEIINRSMPKIVIKRQTIAAIDCRTLNNMIVVLAP